MEEKKKRMSYSKDVVTIKAIGIKLDELQKVGVDLNVFWDALNVTEQERWLVEKKLSTPDPYQFKVLAYDHDQKWPPQTPSDIITVADISRIFKRIAKLVDTEFHRFCKHRAKQVKTITPSVSSFQDLEATVMELARIASEQDAKIKALEEKAWPSTP